jgi:hypothetical protein
MQTIAQIHPSYILRSKKGIQLFFLPKDVDILQELRNFAD